MGRNVQDAIEAQVRLRYSDLLASAGVDASRVALEVLYLLPPEFVRMYIDLFDKSLSWSPQSAGGGGKDEGRVKASGKSRKDMGMHTREMPGAKASGKRYRERNFAVSDEIALKELDKLNRKLIRAVEAAHQSYRKLRDESNE